MNKALIVLADCVDVRSGKRFAKGSEFAPVPNPEQARRLVNAGCLPETAIAVATKAETEAETAAQEAERAKVEQEAAAKKAKGRG